MTNDMNHNRLFVVKYLVHDTIVTHTELVESCQVACQCLQLDIVQIHSQPMDAFNDTVSGRLSNFASSRVAVSKMRM